MNPHIHPPEAFEISLKEKKLLLRLRQLLSENKPRLVLLDLSAFTLRVVGKAEQLNIKEEALG